MIAKASEDVNMEKNPAYAVRLASKNVNMEKNMNMEKNSPFPVHGTSGYHEYEQCHF